MVMTENRFSRARLIEILSDPDSPECQELLAPLSDDERRVLRYRLVQVPTMARLDPNRVPPPPFPDEDMQRLAISMTRKLMDVELGRLLDDTEEPRTTS